MKTYKHLYARVHAFENPEAAWHKARRGKRGRPSVAAFEANAEEGYCVDPYTPLMRADTHLTALRTYVRLAKDLELLSFRQYEYVAKRLAEVGRLLGGWRKQVKKAKITTA